MKHFEQGQVVAVRCEQLKADGATAAVKFISPNLRTLLLEFSTPVLVRAGVSGDYGFSLFVPLLQSERGFEDLFGNHWEVA